MLPSCIDLRYLVLICQRISRKTGLYIGKVLLPLLLIVSITACAQSGSPSSVAAQQPQALPTPSPSLPLLQVTPEVISIQLQPVPDLATAAAQFATALEIPAEQVQVRIRSKDCTVCNLAENGAESRPPLLSLAEASEILVAYDLLWLTVQEFNCAYYFDGKTFTPRGCQMD